MDTVSRNATLTARRDVTERLSIVRVRLDSPLPDFTPGQYIALGLDVSDQDIPSTERGLLVDGPVKLLHRYYSIVSRPTDRELEFFVTRVEEGDLTARLWECGPGSRLWVDGRAQGTFTLDDVPEGRNLVLVATGTGVGPYISMLRTFHSTGRWTRVVLVHGVRRIVELGFATEVGELQERDPSIGYLPTATREGDAYGGLRGRVQSVLEPGVFSSHAGFALDPTTTHVFLCGNPEMIRSVRDLLEARGFNSGEGVEPASIHFERYW